MNDLDQSIIKSLDGKDAALLPHIPYLLQDLWEIGSSPQVISQLLKKHININPDTRILDLGCGKGAISVYLANEFKCHLHGIDAMPEFIDEANHWADKFHQTHLCTFEVGDIREKINSIKNYNVIILGSIGPILGNIERTLKCIRPVLSEEGFVILDDGYIPDGSDFENENYFKEKEIMQQFSNSEFKIIEAHMIDNNYMTESDADIYNKIKHRSHELIQKFPQKKQLFEDYLENQRLENDILENKVVCVTWVLQKSD